MNRMSIERIGFKAIHMLVRIFEFPLEAIDLIPKRMGEFQQLRRVGGYGGKVAIMPL